jgi:hypothetical protein
MTYTATAEFFGARTPMVIAVNIGATKDKAVEGILDDVQEFFRLDETDWQDDVMVCIKGPETDIRSPFGCWAKHFGWSL